MSLAPHTIGDPRPNVEERAFDLLFGRAGVEVCQACERAPLHCRSIHEAIKRLRRQGVVECVKTHGTWLWFVVRDATRPVDKRGLWRKA